MNGGEKIFYGIKQIVKNCLPYGISNHIVKKHKLQWLNSNIPSSDEPVIYNSEGHKLKTIFLKDHVSAYCSYSLVLYPYPSQYIFWDRFNYGLKNHVYTHKDILFPIGKPVKKFAFFYESEAIVPEDYKIFDLHPGLENDFDKIFTYSALFLDKYPNAVFMPALGYRLSDEIFNNDEQYKIKSKNISIASTDKNMCSMHEFRINLAKHYLNNPLVDTYGSFNGGKRLETTFEVYNQYRYNIAVENYICPFYFTEKIIKCFDSMTVPIYIGAEKIADFFNPDGIIQVKSLDYESIDKIIANCNEEDYNSRLPAIIDNFNRVQEYNSHENYLYSHYKNEFV